MIYSLLGHIRTKVDLVRLKEDVQQYGWNDDLRSVYNDQLELLRKYPGDQLYYLSTLTCRVCFERNFIRLTRSFNFSPADEDQIIDLIVTLISQYNALNATLFLGKRVTVVNIGEPVIPPVPLKDLGLSSYETGDPVDEQSYTIPKTNVSLWDIIVGIMRCKVAKQNFEYENVRYMRIIDAAGHVTLSFELGISRG